MNIKIMLSVVTVAAGIAACGGGGGGGNGTLPSNPSTINEVPTSATASPTAYSRYVGSLADREDASPLGVQKVVPPISETEQPIDGA